MKTIDKTLLCQIVGGQLAAAAQAAGPTRTEIGAAAAALGGGVGASFAIESAGGIAALGLAGPPVLAASGAGLYAAWETGQAVGNWLNTFEAVRAGAQGVIEYGAGLGQGVSDYYEGIGAHSCTYAPGMSSILDMPDYSYQ